MKLKQIRANNSPNGRPTWQRTKAATRIAVQEKGRHSYRQETKLYSSSRSHDKQFVTKAKRAESQAQQ